MMNREARKIFLSGNVIFFTALMIAAPAVVLASGDLVKFPEKYSEGVLYTKVHRASITEDIYTSHTAIEAVKSGQAIPDGTVITLVDYREGSLFRYVVMEKRSDWGSDYTPDLRNGEWKCQAFNADKSINTNETLSRCLSCHKSEAGNDFVFTLDAMKNSK